MFTIELKGLDELTRSLDEMQKRMPMSYEKGLKRFCQLCVNSIKKNLAKKVNPEWGSIGIDKGAGLMGSIKYEITKALTSGLMAFVNGEIYSDVPYAEFVEMGTRPHMPPVEKLYLWVRRKLKINDEKQIESVAYAIAKTIAKYGTKAKPYFRPGIEENIPKFESVMKQAFDEDLNA